MYFHLIFQLLKQSQKNDEFHAAKQLHILPQIKVPKKQYYPSKFHIQFHGEAYQVHLLSQFRKDYHSYYAVFHSTLWKNNQVETQLILNL